jgi:hypothetical protein
VIRRSARLVTLVAAAAAATLAGAAGAGSASAASSVTQAASRAAAPAAASPAAKRVLLPTGDEVTTTAGAAGTHIRVQAAHPGPDAIFSTAVVGSDYYVVPASVHGRVGKMLDPALFDVSTLALDAANPLPVSISYASGATPHALPGVSLTGTSGNTATGVITADSAKSFGAALDQPAGSKAADPFAGVTHIAPAGAAAPPVAKPSFQMETLKINPVLPAGLTVELSASVEIVNLDNSTRYSNIFFNDAPFAVSLPKGHYSAMFFVEGTRTDQSLPINWFTLDSQFTVSKDSSITLDANTATSEFTATTPKPAQEDGSLAQVLMEAQAGGGSTGSIVVNETGHQSPDFVTPVKAPTLGTIVTDWVPQLMAPAGTASPYVYDLDEHRLGSIPKNENLVATATNLATVHDVFGDGGVATACPVPAHPWGGPIEFDCYGAIQTPGNVDDFFTADSDTTWFKDFGGFGTEIVPQIVINFRDEQFASRQWETFKPGEQLTQHYFTQPEVPSLAPAIVPQSHADGSEDFSHFACPACRNSAGLDLNVAPFGSPDTNGLLDFDADSASYVVSADGVTVQSGSLGSSRGALSTTVAMPSAATTYGIEYEVTRDPAVNTLSTTTQTSWQIPAKASAPLPTNWRCANGADCTGVLPLLTSAVSLPTDGEGQLAPGTATGNLTLGTVGVTGAPSVTALTVQVSFDGGAHWKKVPAAPDGTGDYALTVAVPAASATSGFGDLKITARAAGGARLTQTIDNAFAVSGK